MSPCSQMLKHNPLGGSLTGEFRGVIKSRGLSDLMEGLVPSQVLGEASLGPVLPAVRFVT